MNIPDEVEVQDISTILHRMKPKIIKIVFINWTENKLLSALQDTNFFTLSY